MLSLSSLKRSECGASMTTLLVFFGFYYFFFFFFFFLRFSLISGTVPIGVNTSLWQDLAPLRMKLNFQLPRLNRRRGRREEVERAELSLFVKPRDGEYHRWALSFLSFCVVKLFEIFIIIKKLL